MKHKLSILAILMMALAIPQSVKAYDFSKTYQGKTLYYNIINGGAEVTYPRYYHNRAAYTSYWYNYTMPTGALTIPDSVSFNGVKYCVTSIGNNAFWGCHNLTSVNIPNSVTNIGYAAFYGCSGLTGTLIIPNSVIKIGYAAFISCSGLNSITISNSVDSIGSDAFSGCSGLTVTNYSGTVAQWCGINFEDADANPINKSHNFYINDIEVTSLVIPESVTRIGNYAFNGWSGLTGTLIIPNSVTSIGRGAFASCSGLNSITISNSVDSIGSEAFFDCSGLTGTLIIPNSVTSIGIGAFAYCSGLNSVTISNLVTNIDIGVFRGCSGLTGTLIIPNSVTSIGYEAFAYCSGLNSVTFPNSIMSIDHSAFYACRSLTSLTLPSSVTSIGDYAFSLCSNMDSITSLATTPPVLGNCVFCSVNSQIPVFVPCESVSSYQSASGWSDFSNIQCNSGQIYTITATSANPTMGTVSGGGSYANGATATLTAMPNSGYHFVRWQDNNTQNPRTITVTANATYTAYFEADGGDDDCPTITSFPWNATFDESLSCWKTVDADGDGYNWVNYQDYVVSESYSYFDGSNQGLTPDNWLISRRIQIPSSGTYNLSWTARGLNDNYFNEHYSVYVSTTGDNPSNFSTQLFSETLNTPNAVNRSKSLENYRGQTIRIAFRHHNTNDVFVLGIGNVKISQGTQGIEDIEENDVHIYVEGQIVHISEIDGQDVTVYSIDGRTVASVTNAAGQCSIPVPATGVYMVKIGNHPARKVVVMR